MIRIFPLFSINTIQLFAVQSGLFCLYKYHNKRYKYQNQTNLLNLNILLHFDCKEHLLQEGQVLNILVFKRGLFKVVLFKRLDDVGVEFINDSG